MKKILALIMTLSIFVLSGCSSQTDRMVTDREGTEVNIPTKIEKIISTAPSNTEVLMALGLGDKLVAIDKYSTDIEGINTELPQIDFLNPDAETIIGLEPDIVIASGHNKTGSVEDPFKAISEAGIPVVYIPSSDSIDGIYKDIEFIADVVNERSKGKEIVDDMKAQVEEIKAIGDTITDKKSVYFEISPAPYLSSFGKSTFLNEMIEIIGAKNIFGNESSWITVTHLKEREMPLAMNRLVCFPLSTITKFWLLFVGIQSRLLLSMYREKMSLCWKSYSFLYCLSRMENK